LGASDDPAAGLAGFTALVFGALFAAAFKVLVKRWHREAPNTFIKRTKKKKDPPTKIGLL